ncbi:helix-turn-helix transcriptional regulator [Streptomyces chartreusis]|uniref:helix-turn-helix transcriptional regulator n=1 Tax=Streptomyces chartreusis TaxID=1969 RepID=UPI0036855081
MANNQLHARELGTFLRARRSRLRPQDVGLEPGGRRKVPGLRREELALLAGLSTDYYQRMEQGREVRPSDDLLDALASALHLDEEERRHLFALADAVRRGAPRSQDSPEEVPAATRHLLQIMNTPGFVLSKHLDVLAWNPLAEALLGHPAGAQSTRHNLLVALFMNPEVRSRCADWESIVVQYIGMLRAAVAADPSHPRGTAIVGELSIRSADFRRLWDQYDVCAPVQGTKVFHRQEIGDITLDWATYPLPGSPGPVLMVYTAKPGTVNAERLQLLGALHTDRQSH